MKELLIILFGLFLTTLALAKDLNYDQIPITPQTWEEVDLTYTNTIDGKNYTEQANLLRPIAWIKQNHLDKVGATAHLSTKQMGIDADVKVVAIKPDKINYNNYNHAHNKPVIATFITHSNDIWNYSFKDSQGNEEVILATPNHSFYSINRQEFIPIGQAKIGEHIKANSKNSLILVNKQKHNIKVELAYNVEVYQQHVYNIGKAMLLAHNPICCLACGQEFPDDQSHEVHMIQFHSWARCPLCKNYFVSKSNLNVHLRTHSKELPFACTQCPRRFNQKIELKQHVPLHDVGSKAFSCPECNSVFGSSNALGTHMRNTYPRLRGEVPNAAAMPAGELNLQLNQGASAIVDEEAPTNLSTYETSDDRPYEAAVHRFFATFLREQAAEALPDSPFSHDSGYNNPDVMPKPKQP